MNKYNALFVSFDGETGKMILMQSSDSSKMYLASILRGEDNYFMFKSVSGSEAETANIMKQIISSWQWK